MHHERRRAKPRGEGGRDDFRFRSESARSESQIDQDDSGRVEFAAFASVVGRFGGLSWFLQVGKLVEFDELFGSSFWYAKFNNFESSFSLYNIDAERGKMVP